MSCGDVPSQAVMPDGEKAVLGSICGEERAGEKDWLRPGEQGTERAEAGLGVSSGFMRQRRWAENEAGDLQR